METLDILKTKRPMHFDLFSYILNKKFPSLFDPHKNEVFADQNDCLRIVPEDEQRNNLIGTELPVFMFRIIR